MFRDKYLIIVYFIYELCAKMNVFGNETPHRRKKNIYIYYQTKLSNFIFDTHNSIQRNKQTCIGHSKQSIQIPIQIGLSALQVGFRTTVSVVDDGITHIRIWYTILSNFHKLHRAVTSNAERSNKRNKACYSTAQPAVQWSKRSGIRIWWISIIP